MKDKQEISKNTEKFLECYVLELSYGKKINNLCNCEMSIDMLMK